MWGCSCWDVATQIHKKTPFFFTICPVLCCPLHSDWTLYVLTSVRSCIDLHKSVQRDSQLLFLSLLQDGLLKMTHEESWKWAHSLFLVHLVSIVITDHVLKLCMHQPLHLHHPSSHAYCSPLFFLPGCGMSVCMRSTGVIRPCMQRWWWSSSPRWWLLR